MSMFCYGELAAHANRFNDCLGACSMMIGHNPKATYINCQNQFLPHPSQHPLNTPCVDACIATPDYFGAGAPPLPLMGTVL